MPEGCQWYVFGSFLHSAHPGDIDVLVVYKPDQHEPRDIYGVVEPVVIALANTTRLPVHLTALTVTEEAELNFISRSGAVHLRSIDPVVVDRAV